MYQPRSQGLSTAGGKERPELCQRVEPEEAHTSSVCLHVRNIKKCMGTLKSRDIVNLQKFIYLFIYYNLMATEIIHSNKK